MVNVLKPTYEIVYVLYSIFFSLEAYFVHNRIFEYHFCLIYTIISLDSFHPPCPASSGRCLEKKNVELSRILTLDLYPRLCVESIAVIFSSVSLFPVLLNIFQISYCYIIMLGLKSVP